MRPKPKSARQKAAHAPPTKVGDRFLTLLAGVKNIATRHLPTTTKLQRQLALLALTAGFLYAAEPRFTKMVTTPKTLTLNPTAQASFQPLAATPFMDARERVIKLSAKRMGKDECDERFRMQVGKLYDSVATTKLAVGLDAVVAQYQAAKAFGVQLDEGFLKYRWQLPKQGKDWKGFLGGDGGNAAAPVSVNQLREESVREYISKYSNIAVSEMNKFDVPASISLAQGIVESRSGQSKLARNNNNHFGMKCFSKKCPKSHCSNMTDDHHKDFFRKYSSAWESWRAHSQLLAGDHYSRLKKYGRDYRQWAYGLKALGYATDRTYAEKLIGMIEKYDLQRFDK